MVKWQKVLLIILLLAGCKKPFEPPGALSDKNKYLVIDGIINSGRDSTFIKLSLTKKFDTVVVIDPETNARVTVESDANANYPLVEIAPGTYSAAPLNLDNSHKYRLRIKTADNKEYVSDFVGVKNSPTIDSIGFKAQNDGVHIYTNTHDATNTTRYYRWEYNEDWKFHSFYHSFWIGSAPRDTTQSVYYCFSKDVSSAILIASSAKLSNDIIYQAPIINIPLTSEKIQVKYSVLVRQYALTSDAYNFWEKLQNNTDRLGSIFDAQPSINQTNYHCVSNPNELVVGYLSVGSYSSKRIFITTDQLSPGYQVTNAFGCKLDTEFYYHPRLGEPNLGDPGSGYTSIDAFYIVPLAPFGAPSELEYSSTICSDCTARGVKAPPPFWK